MQQRLVTELPVLELLAQRLCGGRLHRQLEHLLLQPALDARRVRQLRVRNQRELILQADAA